MSVPKITEIMYTIYQGLSKRWLYKEYVGRKVNDTSALNLRQNFAFACTPSLSSRVITWLEPTIQSKTQKLVSSQLKKKHTTSMSSWPEPAIWSRNTGQQIPCFDRCQLIITWMSNIKDVQGSGNGATLLLFKEWGLVFRQSCDKQKFWDRWVTKLSKVWGSACASLVHRSSANKVPAVPECLWSYFRI